MWRGVYKRRGPLEVKEVRDQWSRNDFYKGGGSKVLVGNEAIFTTSVRNSRPSPSVTVKYVNSRMRERKSLSVQVCAVLTWDCIKNGAC